MNHTPIPWHVGVKPGPIIYGPKGEQIADMSILMVPHEEHIANFRLLLQAVNNHQKLVEALEDLIEMADQSCRGDCPEDDAKLDKAIAALAEAKKGAL